MMVKDKFYSLKWITFPFLIAIFLFTPLDKLLYLTGFTAGDVLAIDGNVADHFTIITPDIAKAGEPFTVKIIAKDESDIVITDYDEVGGDVEITTTGSGTISPTLVAASEFREGIATVDFVYDKAEGFTIIAKEAARVGVREYTIGEEDVLDISVWGWEDLAAEVIVRPDGKISFPLVGDVQAVGLTLTELDRDLTERLKVYIRSPEVSVMLRKFGGRKIIVLGEVGRPGVYSVTGKSTILEAISRAGGFTPHAVLSSTILIRGGLQDPEGRRLNLARAIKKADISQNIVLEPEDIVYVPKKFIANVGYAMNQILGPVYQGIITITQVQALE